MTPAERLIAETEAYLAAQVPIRHQVSRDVADIGFDPARLVALDHLNEERSMDDNVRAIHNYRPVRPDTSRIDRLPVGAETGSQEGAGMTEAALYSPRRAERQRAIRQHRARMVRYWCLTAVGMLLVLAAGYVVMWGLAAVMG